MTGAEFFCDEFGLLGEFIDGYAAHEAGLWVDSKWREALR